MPTVQPRPNNHNALPKQIFECLAALKRNIETLRENPIVDRTIVLELQEVVREIEANLPSIK
jgi:hypothetical protein